MKGDLKVTFEIKIIEFYGIDRILDESRVKLAIEDTYKKIKNNEVIYKNLMNENTNLESLSFAIYCVIKEIAHASIPLGNSRATDILYEFSNIEEYKDAYVKYKKFNNKKILLQCAEKIRKSFKELGL